MVLVWQHNTFRSPARQLRMAYYMGKNGSGILSQGEKFPSNWVKRLISPQDRIFSAMFNLGKLKNMSKDRTD